MAKSWPNYLVSAVLWVSVSGAASALPPGLVSYWTGDATAQDAVGSNDGTLYGGASYAVGRFGQAFDFNGAGSGFNAGTAGLATGNTNRSMMAWVNVQSYTVGGSNELFFAGYGNYGSAGQVYSLGGNSSVTFFSQWGGAVVGGPAPGLNEWHHVAATSSAGLTRLYLDGIQIASGSPTLNTAASSTFYMGEVMPGTGRWLNGMVDDVAVFDRALSATEIQNIMNLGVSNVPEARLDSIQALF